MAAPTSLPHPQSVRAIFFDVGFTLLAPHPSIAEISQAACAEQGLSLDLERLRAAVPFAEQQLRQSVQLNPATWGDEAAINALWLQYFTLLLSRCLPDAAEVDLRRYARAIARAYDSAESYRLFPDVLPVLQALRQHPFTLGIISDWGTSLWVILRSHDLNQYFDFAVVSAAVRHAKPDPELFHTALRRADAIPDYAVHIGDAYPLDVLGARAAGITPILIDRRAAYDPAMLDCLVVRDLYGVLDLLEIARPS